MPDTIVVASAASEYRAFGALIREYWEWLVARYADHPGLIDQIGSHQGLEDELDAVPSKYGPPEGKTLLAVRDGQVSGGVAYRDLHDGSCEMKRLFVPDRFQGHGTGRLLCEALIATASTDGFRLMRLDTGYLNAEATRMYESMGFRLCPPYHDYPPALTPHLRFMEIQLPATRAGAL
jgi:GNAT superfamily N-acetyltransferase